MIKTMDNLYFNCDECPICLEYEYREKIAKILNEDIQIEYCSCDKISLPFYSGGYCEDAWYKKPKSKKRKYKKRDKNYYRNVKDKKFTRKKIISNYTYSFWLGKNDNYIMYPKNSKTKKFYKKISNKKIRQNKFKYGNYSNYKKYFDYKWAVY